MYDGFNRKINYLRISLTDRCNLRCYYCMPNGPTDWVDTKNLLSASEIQEVVKVGASMGINKIRLTVAEIAGIQAAKNTSSLIPLCHPLMITKIDVKTKLLEEGVEAESMVKITGKTGVEMEALNAVSATLLTVYDMCKAVDKEMVIENIRLLNKTKRP